MRAGGRAVPPFPAWRGYACMRVPVRGCACVPVRVYGWRLCARELACCVRCLLTRARTRRIVQRCDQATTSTNTTCTGGRGAARPHIVQRQHADIEGRDLQQQVARARHSPRQHRVLKSTRSTLTDAFSAFSVRCGSPGGRSPAKPPSSMHARTAHVYPTRHGA